MKKKKNKKKEKKKKEKEQPLYIEKTPLTTLVKQSLPY